MRTRVVEVSSPGYRLTVDRGFLAATAPGVNPATSRVPIDDLAAVIADGPGLTISTNLIAELAERGIPLVVCGTTHRPVALALPVVGNELQSQRMRAQVAASRSLKGQLWQQMIKAKIKAQAAVLQEVGRPTMPLLALVKQVRVGDVSSVEATAAKRYWSLVFDSAFTRGDESDPRNAMLNYGYAIVRACVARHLVGTGLHPSLSIHHDNARNPLALADDLIEPFRPAVDRLVVQLAGSGASELNAHSKRVLVGALTGPMTYESETITVSAAVQSLCIELARCFETGKAKLVVPALP